MAASKQATTDLAAEIAEVQAQINELQRIGPPLAELQEAAVAELRRAEAFYKQHGPPPHPLMSPDDSYRALIGSMMASNGDEMIAAKRQCVAGDFKLRGGRGMSEKEKSERLAVQRATLRRSCAQQELIAREREGRGEEVERDGLI